MCTLHQCYSVHTARFKKSSMLSPSFRDMQLPFLMSSSPLRIASIVSGDE